MIQIKNKIIRPNACIEEKDLRDLEQGYNFIKDSYVVQDDTFIFQEFYSIKIGYSTLNDKLDSNYADDWWPKELIPFGYDGNVPIEYVAPDFLSFINNMVEE